MPTSLPAVHQFREAADKDLTLLGLRVAITAWALIIILLAWSVKNKWVLTGVLAWEVFP